MTAKNRNKNIASDKNWLSNQDDVAKRNAKGSERSGPCAPLSARGASFLGPLCYVGLLVAAGFASYYVQRVLEDFSQINKVNEESLQKYADLASRMEAALQQVDAVKGEVSGFDTTISMFRAKLDSVEQAQQRGRAETQRVEEALQRLQKDILKDLSEGIQEVKLTRQRDFSSLEQAVEERLAELSTSIGDSVASVTEVQGQTQSQLRDLRTQLADLADSRKLQQELQALTEATSKLQVSSTAAEKTADSLAGQIGAVSKELQTRNEEVASQSQEISSVRDMVQSTTGSLKQSLFAAEASLQALSDKSQTLQFGLDRAEGGLQSLEKELRGALVQAERSSENTQNRLKVLEDSIDSITASTAEQGAKVESALSKYDSHESTLATLGRDIENVGIAAGQEAQLIKASLKVVNEAQEVLHSQMESLLNNMLELKGTVADLENVKAEVASGKSSQTQQLETLEQRLNTLGEAINEDFATDHVKASISQVQSDLHQLRAVIDNLVLQSEKVEIHQEAISSLHENLKNIQDTILSSPTDSKVLEGED